MFLLLDPFAIEAVDDGNQRMVENYNHCNKKLLDIIMRSRNKIALYKVLFAVAMALSTLFTLT